MEKSIYMAISGSAINIFKAHQWGLCTQEDWKGSQIVGEWDEGSRNSTAWRNSFLIF